MAALTGAMLALSAASTLNKYVTGRRAATTAVQTGNYERGASDQNAKYADAQAADALARGQTQEMRYHGQLAQLRGDQRGAYAAQGIDANTGSAEDVQGDSQALGELDALTIRNNAAREAWGYGVQATNYRNQGALAMMAGQNQAGALRSQATDTLLTGAGDLWNTWRQRQQNNAGPAGAPNYGTPPGPGDVSLTPNTPQRVSGPVAPRLRIR